MVEERGLLRVQGGDGAHVLGTQLEIENREILDDPFLAHRLRNCDHAPLGEPPKNDLGNGLVIFAGDRAQEFVLKDVVFAFGEGPP